MANLEHLDPLMQGVEQWNAWRRQNPVLRPDLHGAHLCATRLGGADFHGAILTSADLSYADLYKADLSGANLQYADLSYADLNGATLKQAALQHALLYQTTFSRIDLCDVQGLAELDHRGPSRIELHTVQLPWDDRALHFLRGAGVPNEWINDYRIHTMHPFQYHSCFLSHSSKDEALVRRLYADLQARGVRCWFAPEDLKIGDTFRPRIDEAIHLHEKLLLVLSEYSVQSPWVEHEVEAAFEKEAQEKRLVLFPISVDSCVLTTHQAWAAHLRRTRHIGDFTRWAEPAAYHLAFERLLRDLRKADTLPS